MRSRQQQILILATIGIFALLGCGALLIGAGLVGRGKPVAVALPPAKRIVYGLAVMPARFDPHVGDSYEMGIVLRSIYDTLLYRDPKTRLIVPGLAEKWAISDDGLTYTFTLRKGVVFHDGTPFDSGAVVATLNRITNPVTKSQAALALLGPYDHSVAIDAQTVQIVLKSPYAPLLDALCQFYTGIASPTATKQYDASEYQFHQVGTGPFYMLDYIPGDHFTLRRNPDYKWGPSFYTPAGPNSIDEVEFRFFDDPATRADALAKGQVDILGELSPSDAIQFTANSAIHPYPHAIPGEPLQFLFNTTQAPTDKFEVRQALTLATSREAVVDAVFQQFSPIAYGPVSAVTPFYDPTVKSKYVYNTKVALDLLTALGYSDTDGDKFLDIDKKRLHIVMVVPAYGLAPQVADQIQKQWRDVGIELEVREVPNIAGLRDAVKRGDYNMIAYNDFGLDASIVNPIFRSDGALNWLHYADGDMDSWLTRSTESLDTETRQNMFSAIQNQALEQALVLPIRDYVNLNGARASIKGLSFDAYGWYPLLANLTLASPTPAPQ